MRKIALIVLALIATDASAISFAPQVIPNLKQGAAGKQPRLVVPTPQPKPPIPERFGPSQYPAPVPQPKPCRSDSCFAQGKAGD